MTDGEIRRVGEDPATRDEGSQGPPLPAESYVAGYDRELTVLCLNGSPLRSAASPGLSLTDLLGVGEDSRVEAAARRALDGRAATVSCRAAPHARELVVRFGPDRSRPGTALALWFQAPVEGDGPSAERERADELELIATVARELARSTDSDEVRTAICRAALSICSADVAVHFEPAPDPRLLTAAASLGADLGGSRISLVDGSAPADAMRDGAPRFTAEPGAEPADCAELLASLGVGSVVWQPIARGRSVKGLLMAGWERSFDAVHPRSLRLLEVISVEAAVAIDRGTAFGQLVSMAQSDPLTGLPNRRAWAEALERELARADRTRTPLAVAMIDLDGFKAYNDRHGHPAGDRLLQRVASSWLALVRATDVLARYGGDEFALALPGCDLSEGREMLARLAAEAEIGFCGGVVRWQGEADGEALVERADKALYRAKTRGPGAVVTDP